MIHDYTISGMTCSGCEATVKNLLSQAEGVQKVTIDLLKATASVEMDRHIATNELQKALATHPKYQLSEKAVMMPSSLTEPAEEKKSWFETYKPILLIFFYITLVTFIVSFSAAHFDITLAMRVFMAGFFLVFSFFKLLDIRGFADSYSSYDILAKQWHGYGFLYPFIELALGIAYLLNITPGITNIITIIVMGTGTIGVVNSVMNKRKIRCACLGAVFNLPMSTVTILEDVLMVGMAVAMLVVS